MKTLCGNKFYYLAQTLLTVVCFNIPAHSQNYLSQSFDGAGTPTGWSTATYAAPASGCGSTYGCAWYREPGSTGTPGPATHSGAGYMFYDCYSIDVGGTAELTSPSIDFSTYSTGINQVSFWLYRNVGISSISYLDSVAVYVNTSASSSGATLLGSVAREAILPPIVSVSGWYKYTYQIPASFSGSTNYIIFKAFSDYGYDIYLDDVSVDHIPPCSGYPVITGISPAGPLYTCLGAMDTLSVNTSSSALGLKYQWQLSRDTGTTWLNIVNDTNQFTLVLSQKTVLYRAKVTCNYSGSTSTSNPVTVFVSPGNIKYASLPYSLGFESWFNSCGSHDRPDSSWTAYPASGNDAWRRDDEGFTYGSWTGGSGYYSPAFYEGSHSARFHSFIAPNGSTGEMELYLNCSADTLHAKELRFYYSNITGDDFIQLMLSTDSGLTFTPVAYLGTTGLGNWQQFVVPFFSKASKTVFRFLAVSDYDTLNSPSILRNPYRGDIGLDKVQVLAPCSGKPAAGSIVPVTACSGSYFKLSLTGTSEMADLTYKWQSSTDSSSWSNMVGDTFAVAHPVVYNTTYYRVIVKCPISGQSDTSALFKVVLRPFYYCYCDPMEYTYGDYNPSANIGNVTIKALPTGTTVLNNGTASPIFSNPTATHSYSNFDSTITTPILFLDSTYKLSVTEITKFSDFSALGLRTAVDIWIDYNHDAMFEDIERLYPIWFDTTAVYTRSDTFQVPHTVLTGLTGMRIKFDVGEYENGSSCGGVDTRGHAGPFIYGEYEDYLVNISYLLCSGHVNAGKVRSTDTFPCNNTPILLSDTSHEHHMGGVTWSWQYSIDSVDWYDIAGTTNKDSVIQTFTGSIWYRVRMLCPSHSDTSYSDTLHIMLAPPYKCYCASFADGGYLDTSDIGLFSINGFTVNKGGSHLNNPAATHGYEEHSLPVINLWKDSVYTATVFYIMHDGFHSDARITLFMDFNNNYQYDIPTENVWTGTITASAPTVTANIKIPDALVTGVPTGMRLIINNNTAANIPSDYACGSYTSGETMDFTVKFHDFLEVKPVGGLQDIDIYPNPTTGKFTLVLNTTNTIHKLQLNIMDMMGRQVQQYSYENISGSFKTAMDLNDQPKGMYFIEIMADGERSIRKLVLN